MEEVFQYRQECKSISLYEMKRVLSYSSFQGFSDFSFHWFSLPGLVFQHIEQTSLHETACLALRPQPPTNASDFTCMMSHVWKVKWMEHLCRLGVLPLTSNFTKGALIPSCLAQISCSKRQISLISLGFPDRLESHVISRKHEMRP